jgi:hypothetical protein
MLMRLKFVIVALFAIAPAFADPVATKLTVGQAWQIINALHALDGHQEIVHDGDRQSVVTVPYKFGPGFRWALATDWTALQPIAEAYQKAARAEAGELSPGGAIKDGTPEAKKFAEADAILQAKEQTVNIVRLKLSEFALEKNDIPISALSALSPIIDP